MNTNSDIEIQILNPLFDNKFDLVNFQNFLNESLPNCELKKVKKNISNEYKSFIDFAYDLGVYKGQESNASNFFKNFCS